MNGSQAHLNLEVVAAITAALSAALDKPIGSFAVTSIRPEQAGVHPHTPSSAWAMAGVLESHFTRRQFTLRGR